MSQQTSPRTERATGTQPQPGCSTPLPPHLFCVRGHWSWQHNKQHKGNTRVSLQGETKPAAGMAGCAGEKTLIPVWIGFVCLLFPRWKLVSLMVSVTLHYTRHSWTAASRQSRLIKIGTTKNIWVTNKLLLLINGGASICASGCKILLFKAKQWGTKPLAHSLILPPSLASAVSERARTSSTSITLHPSHLGVCLFPARIRQNPSRIWSKHCKENQAGDTIQVLAGQMQTQTHIISCCSLLSWGFVLPISDYLDCRARDHLLCACSYSLQNNISIAAASP